MKTFQEVFPELRAEEPLYSLLGLLKVERIGAADDFSSLTIYVLCGSLVEWKLFRQLEEAVKEQLFPKKRIRISIRERFSLPEHFSLETVFHSYEESIFSELSAKDLMQYRIFRHAKISFPGEQCLSFTAEDTALNRRAAERLKTWLQDDLFGFRFGMQAEIREEWIPYIREAREEIVSEPLPVRQTQPEDDEFLLPSDNEGQEMLPGAETGSDRGDGSASGEKNTAGDGTNAGNGSSAGKEDGAGKGAEAGKKKNAAGQRKSREAGRKKYGRTYQSSYSQSQGRKSDNPDVIYGKDFTDEFLPMRELDSNGADVTLRGKILDLESRFIEKSETTLFIFNLTDFTDSVSVKFFCRLYGEELDALKGQLKNGAFIKLRGVTGPDRRTGELCITTVFGMKKCEPFRLSERRDTAPVKRVELHCHTKMSDLDAVSSAKDIIARAKSWGMEALAITDHGNIQAFPEAWHAVEKDRKGNPKILYGMEGYLVDDERGLVTNPGEETLDSSFVVFDIETTGFSAEKDAIIEIGAVKVVNGKIKDKFSTFVNPCRPIPFRIEQLTSINDRMVADAGTIEEILPEFISFCEGSAVVAHNADFDTGFIRTAAKRQGIAWNPCILDTVSLAHVLLPKLNRFKLDTVAKALGVSLDHHHRAVDDAGCTAEIFLCFLRMIREKGITKVRDIERLNTDSEERIRKMNTYHVIILVKNEIGRVNLYRLISDSNLKYFSRRPRIPKSELHAYREGLIIGSACEAGELFQAMLRNESPEDLNRIASFYDYLEIQPIGNNRFMIGNEHYPVESEEDLKELNRRIVKIGDDLGKPVCATCDVHFLDPEDEIYRRMIMFGSKFDDADAQPPLYLRTTDEMLREFEYLGPEKCEEVVITNTRMIADMVENISPVRPDKCPPVIPDSDRMLRETCYRKAEAQYGTPLPEIVSTRLEKELGSIIKNGFAVMYIIAQKLVLHSNEEGYLVGSRGSVGSSFVAYTADITEVNPLPPHYYCPDCKYSDFDSEMPKKYAGTAGCDMPDAVCPRCGRKLKKDGFDIPFETFLGFKGDKEPDIDLNFSGENQSSAHAYTEVIFGKGQTFRAGTVGTLADKTAFGYVKHYYEEHQERKRDCEIKRIADGCVGVRRTTGQHPGGIVVLPKGESIYSFTPIQHPANDMTTPIITTHFEYHAIDHNLLKLDILGHQDPTMIRMLQDLTKIDPVKDIPLDSPEVMSLFQNTSALGVTPDDILGCRLGALGIPEFGTDFAMNMVMEAKPKGFSDLVRIAGLAHGTDVWQGNAEVLIKEGKATIQTAICTRDDIMIFLIHCGMDPQESFKIMESVRKGKGLSAEWESHMREHDVPDWYIWSCKKIKYMFPKAHAAAYVMMAWRIGYCKIFYPLAYYASFFSIRANGFSYEVMCQGREKLEYFLAGLKSRVGNRENPLSPKEEDMLKDGRIVQEMYARGFEFLPIDIYRAKASRFSIIDGKIMPSLTSIEGLGESAAGQIVEAAEKGPFLSKDDFKTRTGTGQTTCDLLCRLGILKGLPESNQLSLFDVLG